jgi:hypothetical protein
MGGSTILSRAVGGKPDGLRSDGAAGWTRPLHSSISIPAVGARGSGTVSRAGTRGREDSFLRCRGDTPLAEGHAHQTPRGVAHQCDRGVDESEPRYKLTIDFRDWPSKQDLVVSTVFEESDVSLLRIELRSPLGVPVQFDVYSQWRRSGCMQSIDLTDIDVTGLRDGETGAVPLSELKRAILTRLAKDTNVEVTGECGRYSLIAPPTSEDNGRFLSCARNGSSLHCRYEGEFRVTPGVYTLRHKSASTLLECSEPPPSLGRRGCQARTLFRCFSSPTGIRQD